MLQILGLIFQPLVNRAKLFALLLTVSGGALLVMLKMIADTLIFLLEFGNAFLQLNCPCNGFVALGFCLGQADVRVFQGLVLLTFSLGNT